MSRGLNKAQLIGHLGKDPELKTFSNGGQVCNATLATSEQWKDRDGNSQEDTQWHNLVFNNKLAEIAHQYLRKGAKIYVEGKIVTRKYEKNNEDRYITEIRVLNMLMLDSKGDNQGSGGGYSGGGGYGGSGQSSSGSRGSSGGQGGSSASGQTQQRRQDPPPQNNFEDDDIPF